MSKLDVSVSDKFIELIKLIDDAEEQGFKLKLYAFPMLDNEGALSSYKLFLCEELGYCQNKLQIRWNSNYVEEPIELPHSRHDVFKNMYYINVANSICEIILKDMVEKGVDNTFIAKNNGVPVAVDKGFFSVSNYNGELLMSCKY